MTSDVNKTKILRPRPRPEQQDQDEDRGFQDHDQDRAFVPRAFVQYNLLLIIKTVSFSIVWWRFTSTIKRTWWWSLPAGREDTPYGKSRRTSTGCPDFRLLMRRQYTPQLHIWCWSCCTSQCHSLPARRSSAEHEAAGWLATPLN